MASPFAVTETSLAWKQLTDHLGKWFYRPDIEALEVVFSALCSHYTVDSDPIWLFLIGPSSSGKTSIAINAAKMLPNAYVVGSLTSKTLMSHYQQGKDALLNKIGASGILLFKDFTTFLSLREDEQRELTSQFREIYDGEMASNAGVPGFDLWKGKISVLGVCTSTFERAWAFRREMGERFLQVRWPRVDSIRMAQFSASQRGKENEIHRQTQELGLAFCHPHTLRRAQPLPPELSERLAYLSEMVARVRGSVIRDTHGNRDIIDIPPAEQNPRLHKSLELLVDTHSQLFKCEPDLRVALRVAKDSMPVIRSSIINCIPDDTSITHTEVCNMTRIPEATIRWNSAELHALGIIVKKENAVGSTVYEFTPEYLELKHGFFA